MRVKIEAGAELDIVTNDELDGKLGGLRKALSPGPIYLHKREDAGTMPASGNLVLDLGGPPAGLAWDVKILVVSSIDPTTSTTGRVQVFISAQPPNLSPLMPTDSVGATNTIPSDFTWSSQQAIMRYGERLYVVYNTVASGTTMVAAARLLEGRIQDLI